MRRRGGGRGQLQKKNKPDFCWDVDGGNAGQWNMWSSGAEGSCKRSPNMALFPTLAVAQSAVWAENMAETEGAIRSSAKGPANITSVQTAAFGLPPFSNQLANNSPKY